MDITSHIDPQKTRIAAMTAPMPSQNTRSSSRRSPFRHEREAPPVHDRVELLRLGQVRDLALPQREPLEPAVVVVLAGHVLALSLGAVADRAPCDEDDLAARQHVRARRLL